MTAFEKEQSERRLRFREILANAGITQAQAAELLDVSLDTVKGWLKPATSKSSNPLRRWPIELLEFKTCAKAKKR